MASGRLASGSIAAGGATKLYRNTTGNAQVVTLLASSQVSGKSPKLNVKISSDNILTSVTQTTVTSGNNHTISTGYPTLANQIVGGSTYSDAALVTHSGSRLHLGVKHEQAGMSMGQSWSKGKWGTPGAADDYPWGKASFDGQPMGTGGDTGSSKFRHHNHSNSHSRKQMQCIDPYYFENPNAFNQNKARYILPGDDSSTFFHVQDISKMPPETLLKYYNTDYSAGSTYYSHTNPGTNGDLWGTVTQSSTPGSYANRGWCYDLYTGLMWGWNASGYNSYMYFDEAIPTMNTSPYRNYGDSSSQGGVWRWSNGNWTGSDPASYETDGRGSPYGTVGDCANGLIISTAGTYTHHMGLKYYGPAFDNMTNKDTRVINQDLETFSRSSYYHTINNLGSASYLRLQWVAYNPGAEKWYACFWDPSGTYTDSPVASIGTSYSADAGIFEVDVTRVRGKDQSVGNTWHDTFANAVTDGLFTKKGEVPDTTSGLMSKPMRLSNSLWTAHCQDGNQYFSTDLYTWAVKSATYIPDAYQMVNSSAEGTAGTPETTYYIATGSTSVLYSSSVTGTADLYDQAEIAGIIAKGAVTPYEQKSIILSNGDSIYVENEDATNGISVTAMGVDI